MAEMVIGEKVTLEEMGGARDALLACRAAATSCCKTEDEAIAFCKRYLAYMPENWRQAAAARAPRAATRRQADLRARSSRPTRTRRST